MQSRFDPTRDEAQLVHMAADGETFGHHHRFGEMALAYLISRLEEDGELRLTNYGEFLSLVSPASRSRDRRGELLELCARCGEMAVRLRLSGRADPQPTSDGERPSGRP